MAWEERPKGWGKYGEPSNAGGNIVKNTIGTSEQMGFPSFSAGNHVGWDSPLVGFLICLLDPSSDLYFP